MLITEVFSLGWRACLGCGSYRVGESLCCPPCLDTLTSNAGVSADGPVRSLFDWIPGQSDLLSRLILALKGPHQKIAWAFWARAFTGSVGIGSLYAEFPTVFIPCPRRSAGPDHAVLWARGLGRELGWPIYENLYRLEGNHQRSRTRSDRFFHRQFVKMTEIPDFSETRVIFVDDVVTTGATWMAFREIQGHCAAFEVWSLARRSRLSCGAPKSLIEPRDP